MLVYKDVLNLFSEEKLCNVSPTHPTLSKLNETKSDKTDFGK